MWKRLLKNQLQEFLCNLNEKNKNLTVNSIEAFRLIEGKGAFVEITCKEDAEKLYLSDICVIYGSKLEVNYEKLLTEDFPQACFVTAESKTADIEKKLVSGVHGPKECYFVILQ